LLPLKPGQFNAIKNGAINFYYNQRGRKWFDNWHIFVGNFN
jgi:hypothetical protein